MLLAWQSRHGRQSGASAALSDIEETNTMRALLEWQLLAGADEAIGNAAIDRFAASATRQAARSRAAIETAERPPKRPVTAVPAPEPARPQPASAARAAPQTPDEAVFAAREAAAHASSLEELEALVRSFDGCALKATAKSTCFADGNPASGIMFIGEGPGREEDLSGTPFVGRAGQLLDRMLAAIGLDRSGAYITNIVFWRPPGNRTPTPAESATCRPFTERQIVLARPKILVLLGGAAAKQMLDTTTGIMRLRGKWRSYTPPEGEPIRTIATLHPAFLLRQPQQKKQAWHDFLEIRKALDEAGD